MTNYCKYCDQEIEWRENQEGRWVAVDPEDNDPYNEPEWHDCSGKNDGWQSERKECYGCHKEIYFSDKNKAPSGKYIPMDAEIEKPHRCEKPKKKSLDELFWST